MVELTDEQSKELQDQVVEIRRDLSQLAGLAKETAASRLTRAKEKVMGASCRWVEEHPAMAMGAVAGVAASVGLILGLVVRCDRS